LSGLQAGSVDDDINHERKFDFPKGLEAEVKSKAIEYLAVSEEEINLMCFMLKDCSELDVQIKLKTLHLINGFMSKRQELDTFLTRMVLIKGDDEIEMFKRYSVQADELLAASETLRLRIFSEELEQMVGAVQAAIHRNDQRLT
jgi:hypothetical protein